MLISRFLDKPIAYHRVFVCLGSGVTGAVMLSQAIYWSSRTGGNEGWFYKTQTEWEGETGLTRYEQEGARKKLKKLGVIEEIKKGVPCKTWYRVNFSVLDNLLIQYAENQQTRMLKTNTTDCGKPADSAAENQQSITENTQRLHRDYDKDYCAAEADAKPSSQVDGVVTENSKAVEQEKPKTKRAIQIPESFQPLPQHIELAEQLGVNLEVELHQFADYHRAKGSAFKDWNAALRTWIRNAHRFSKGKGNQSKQGYFRKPSEQINYWEGVTEDGKF